HFHQADACSLPYAEAAFDAVISNALLHHLRRPQEALREMVRVLRPGGLLFVRDSLRQPDATKIVKILRRSTLPGAFPVSLTLKQAQLLAKEAGLPAEWVQPAGPRHWLLCSRVTPCSRGFDADLLIRETSHVSGARAARHRGVTDGLTIRSATHLTLRPVTE